MYFRSWLKIDTLNLWTLWSLIYMFYMTKQCYHSFPMVYTMIHTCYSWFPSAKNVRKNISFEHTTVWGCCRSFNLFGVWSKCWALSLTMQFFSWRLLIHWFHTRSLLAHSLLAFTLAPCIQIYAPYDLWMCAQFVDGNQGSGKAYTFLFCEKLWDGASLMIVKTSGVNIRTEF